MKVVILAAGKGKRLWPYTECRNKTMIKLSNKPIIGHLVDALSEAEEIIILSSTFTNDLRRYFKNKANVKIIDVGETNGNAETLSFAKPFITDNFVLLYGDVWLSKNDIHNLLSAKENTLLLSKSPMQNLDISVKLENNNIIGIRIASRSEEYCYGIGGYVLTKHIFENLKFTPEFFNNLNVGVMPSQEHYLEALLNSQLAEGFKLTPLFCEDMLFDINKPWDVLSANDYINSIRTQKIYENDIALNTYIDPTSNIDGKIILGSGSKIGKNVQILGNVIIGENTIIDNGAIIEGGSVIGNNCIIKNYCLISSGFKGNSTIGDNCIIGHAAEIYNSIIMDNVSFSHFSEFYGIVGQNTDIAAGTISASLRFDDSACVYKPSKKKYLPKSFNTAVYLGDYNRTGIGSMLMPGIMTGIYCVIGSGVLLDKNLDNKKIILLKQETTISSFGPDNYGL